MLLVPDVSPLQGSGCGYVSLPAAYTAGYSCIALSGLRCRVGGQYPGLTPVGIHIPPFPGQDKYYMSLKIPFLMESITNSVMPTQYNSSTPLLRYRAYSNSNYYFCPLYHDSILSWHAGNTKPSNLQYKYVLIFDLRARRSQININKNRMPSSRYNRGAISLLLE